MAMPRNQFQHILMGGEDPPELSRFLASRSNPDAALTGREKNKIRSMFVNQEIARSKTVSRKVDLGHFTQGTAFLAGGTKANYHTAMTEATKNSA